VVSQYKLGASREQDAGEWVVRLCRAVRESLDAERVIAWLYDAPGQAACPIATDEADDDRELLERWDQVPLERFPAACTALLELRPAEVPDAQSDARIPADLAADFGMSSVRFEPLAAGVPVGMLSVEPASAAASPELYSLLPVVAAGVARVASSRETRRRGAEADFLLGLADSVGAAQTLDEALEVLCERTAAQLDARGGSVFLLNAGRLEPAATRLSRGPRDPAEAQAFHAAGDPPPAARAAIQAGRPVVSTGPDSPLIGAEWAQRLQIGSLLAVPLGRDGRAVGALLIDDSASEGFSDEDAAVAHEAAGRAAPMVEQLRAAEESVTQARAATAIRRLLQQGAGVVTISEAAELVARIARETLGAERASVLLEQDGDRLEHVVTVGDDGDFGSALVDQLANRPATELKLWGAIERNPRPLFVGNASASRLLARPLVERLGLRSYAAMPLIAKDRTIGMVVLTHCNRDRVWDEESKRVLGQLVLEASLVVENAALRAAEHDRLDQLAEQAFHDPLTGLPNRSLFANRLEHAFARINRRKSTVAVLFLDLDGFKAINDNNGHEAGDRLLVAVTRRLQASLRPEDTIARLGGDEFTVLIEDLIDTRFVTRVAERIAESLKTPFLLNGHEASITASIGIAVSTGMEAAPEELLRNADAAMYEAKRAGKARYVIYRDSGTPPAPARAVAGIEDAAGLDDAEIYDARPPDELEDMEVINLDDALDAEPVESPELGEPLPADPAAPQLQEPHYDEPATRASSNGADADEAPEPETEIPSPTPSRSSLSAARRRRRLRFPPRL
jgi:diguanylate cyclase (GGDEF)-like protein